MPLTVVPTIHITSNTINKCTASEVLFPAQEIASFMQNPESIVPSTKPINVAYRGPASSGAYSQFTRSIYSDIATLYQAQQQITSDASIANEGAIEKYNSLTQEISALNDKLTALQTLYNNLLGIVTKDPNSDNTITLIKSLYDINLISYGGFPSYYPSNAPLPANQRAVYTAKYSEIAGSYGQAPISKAYIIDPISGLTVTPDGVLTVESMSSSPSYTPYDMEENDTTFAVDGTETDFYRRNVYFLPAQNVVSLDVTYRLTIPSQFVNDLKCNYVVIHPYPEFQQHIISVIAHGPNNTTNVQLLPLDSAGNIQPITNAGKVRILFPDMDVESVEVIMRQDNINDNLKPGLQGFISGLCVIDVGYTSFNQNQSRILIPFKLTQNYFLSIVDVTPTVPGVSFNIWYSTGGGDIKQTALGATIPGQCQTVYVEAVFTPSTGIMPVLNSIALEFVPLLGLN